MIEFSPISNGGSWTGSSWSITDEDELAKLIARIALGQSRYALKILRETNCTAFAPTKTALEGAKKLLTASPNKDPWHRDGWLFQAISWISAHLQQPDTLKSPPHMIHAHKGFDGIHLKLDTTGCNVEYIIVCEEKATDGPRGKITSQVWPEFASLELGTRDHELVSEAISMLEIHNHVNPEQAIQEILWKQARAYRVSITTGDKEQSEKGLNNLFKGYEEIVKGEDTSRRRAETLHLKNLREWMQIIAEKAIKAAIEIEAENV